MINQNILCILITLFFFGCSAKKNVSNDNESNENKEERVETESKNSNFLDNAEPFYPLKESIEDIQNDINELRTRVINYESQVRPVHYNTTIKKMIEVPKLKQEIFMNNGTLIQGTVLSETMDNLIIDTNIGQLTIDKSDVDNIREVASVLADVSFLGDAEEKIETNYRIYNGLVKNEGLDRANFVRVIFKLWGSETDLIATDSSFVDGAEIIYQSGIISDTSINPGESATYEVRVFVPRDERVQYITRDVHWEIYQ
tara:strand:+ start:38 stop:808 length:771 start_codon:yes stop_codon:yes gene_type:complete